MYKNTIVGKLREKKPLRFWIRIIIVTSFVAKLVAGFALKESFFQRGNSYSPLNSIALNLIHSHEFSVEKGIASIDYEPLYPYLMAGSYKIFGTNWFGITFSQAALYALTSWLLFLIGKHIRNELSGFIIAGYHSFYPPLFLHSISVIDTTLFVALLITLIYLIVVKLKQTAFSWPACAKIGIVIGLSLLCRGSIIFILPAVLIYLYVAYKSDLKRLVIVSIIIGPAVLLTISPWIIRNYSHTGALVISSHGGFGVWQGNNEKTEYYLKNNISLDRIYQDQPPPSIYEKYPMNARSPEAALEVDRQYKSEAIRFIKKHPMAFLKLAILKFVKLWSWKYNPTALSYAYGGLGIRQFAYFISYCPLLIALPFGLIYFYRKSFDLFILFLGSLGFYTLGHMITMGYTRLRLPIDPILMVILGAVMAGIFAKKPSEAL